MDFLGCMSSDSWKRASPDCRPWGGLRIEHLNAIISPGVRMEMKHEDATTTRMFALKLSILWQSRKSALQCQKLLASSALHIPHCAWFAVVLAVVTAAQRPPLA